MLRVWRCCGPGGAKSAARAGRDAADSATEKRCSTVRPRALDGKERRLRPLRMIRILLILQPDRLPEGGAALIPAHGHGQGAHRRTSPAESKGLDSRRERAPQMPKEGPS